MACRAHAGNKRNYTERHGKPIGMVQQPRQTQNAEYQNSVEHDLKKKKKKGKGNRSVNAFQRGMGCEGTFTSLTHWQHSFSLQTEGRKRERGRGRDFRTTTTYVCYVGVHGLSPPASVLVARLLNTHNNVSSALLCCSSSSQSPVLLLSP